MISGIVLVILTVYFSGGRARQLSETQQEELYDVVLLTLEVR